MITINIPTARGETSGFALQPTDAGEKFTGIATFGIQTSSTSLTGDPVGHAGLLNVEMSANTNNAGETRLLTKVTAPYFAVKSTSCGCDGTSTPSFAKSGTIGAHLVITLPKGFSKDYTVANTTWTARRQLNAVIGVLLQALAGRDYETVVNPQPLVSLSHEGNLEGGYGDYLGLFDPNGSVNRAIMGLRPAAPDKTYGRKYTP